MTTVCVTISFDLLHDGHIDHLEKAHKIGDKVVIIVDPDKFLINKKGYALMPLQSRMRIANFLKENISWIEDIVVSIDKDGTCAETLRMIKPNIFAKGGDRTPSSMPKNEIEVCKEINCCIVYGVGEQLNSSTKLVEELWEKQSATDKREP